MTKAICVWYWFIFLPYVCPFLKFLCFTINWWLCKQNITWLWQSVHKRKAETVQLDTVGYYHRSKLCCLDILKNNYHQYFCSFFRMTTQHNPHQAKKKRHVNQERQAPFPVPISSITNQKCGRNYWYQYTGRHFGEHVIVNYSGDISYLNNMVCIRSYNLTHAMFLGVYRIYAGCPTKS